MDMTKEQMTERIKNMTPKELGMLGCSTVEEALELFSDIDPETARREAGEALEEYEKPLLEVVEEARSFRAEYPDDRLTGLSVYYAHVQEQLLDGEPDLEHIMMLLVVAVWNLAEDKDRVDALLDGTRRTAAE